jgi:hypothetical protein
MDPIKLQAARIGCKKALAYMSTASVSRDPADMAAAIKLARAGVAEATKALAPEKKAPAKKKAAPKKKADK